MFERTSRGYYRAHGRADDTMNIGGIKVCIYSLMRYDLQYRYKCACAYKNSVWFNSFKPWKFL